MAGTTGHGNSFSGPLYRDALRIASARTTDNTVINAAVPLFAVPVGPAGKPDYFPGSDATTRIDTQPGMFLMGPGDRLEVIAGGAGADDSTLFALITRIDRVLGPDGTPVAFIERELARATFVCGTTTFGVGNPASAGLAEIEDTDRIADVVSLSAAADGVIVISPGSNAPFAAVLAKARQSEIMRVQVYRGTTTAAWLIAKRLQGDSRPVVR